MALCLPIASDKLIKIVKNTQKIGTTCERKHICNEVDIEMQINKMMENGVYKAASQHSVPCKEHGKGWRAARGEILGIHRVARKHCWKNHLENLCLMQSNRQVTHQKILGKRQIHS